MKTRGFTLVEVIIVLVIAAIIALVFISPLMGFPCRMQWAESGLPYKFGILSGCKISTDGGKTWIPDSKYRKTDE